MARTKGSKNRKDIKLEFVSNKKGWPKGKKRGPRKDLHQLHLDAHAMMLKNMPKVSSDP